jgi:hypothetical protein
MSLYASFLRTAQKVTAVVVDSSGGTKITIELAQE